MVLLVLSILFLCLPYDPAAVPPQDSACSAMTYGGWTLQFCDRQQPDSACWGTVQGLTQVSRPACSCSAQAGAQCAACSRSPMLLQAEIQAMLAPDAPEGEAGPEGAVAAAAGGAAVAPDVELGFTGDSAAGPEPGRPSGK